MPENFPFEPPHFYFLTENGLYETGKKVCISIGEFHKDQYRAALGVSGFCNQLVSGLIGWKTMGTGIAIVKTTVEHKKKLASITYDYNRTHYGDIIAKIDSAYGFYSAKWDLNTVPQELKVRLGLATPTVTTLAPTSAPTVVTTLVTDEAECLPGSSE